jgi:Mn-containing catalase
MPLEVGPVIAAMQYSIQGLNCDDLERKDLLMDIDAEELSHLEIVGALARLHLKPRALSRFNTSVQLAGRRRLRRRPPFLSVQVSPRFDADGRESSVQFRRSLGSILRLLC